MDNLKPRQDGQSPRSRMDNHKPLHGQPLLSPQERFLPTELFSPQDRTRPGYLPSAIKSVMLQRRRHSLVGKSTPFFAPPLHPFMWLTLDARRVSRTTKSLIRPGPLTFSFLLSNSLKPFVPEQHPRRQFCHSRLSRLQLPRPRSHLDLTPRPRPRPRPPPRPPPHHHLRQPLTRAAPRH